jgi:type I restriction enzyme M protein
MHSIENTEGEMPEHMAHSENINKIYKIIYSIMGGASHSIRIFDQDEISSLNFVWKKSRWYLKCRATGKDRTAKPEEIVRQIYLYRLIERYGYDVAQVDVEKPVYFGSSVHKKSADIVVFDKNDPETAYIIVECKKPKRNDGIEQLKSYCNAEGSPIGVWTNGGQVVALHREEPNIFRELTEIPSSNETLSDILNEKVTLNSLISKNKLVHERTTLKEIILDIENLVLANAGVDAFDEIFKLVYAKLYDEWRGAQAPDERSLKFRVGGGHPN